MRVSLFVTCLVDQLFPHVGEATVAVLRRVGVDVDFPPSQTCCGQVAFNDGFWDEAVPLARRFIETFQNAEAIVVPSGSCAAMVREFYPALLRAEPELAERARDLGHRTYELSEFLIDVLNRDDVDASFPHRVTYHPACHGLRTLGLAEQPLRLLARVRGLRLVPLARQEDCCGFGGMFAVKFSALSTSMLAAKLEAIAATDAEVVTATDVSCLMQIAGGLSRGGSRTRATHLAEILASQ